MGGRVGAEDGLWRSRRTADAGAALALAVLGLLILGLRVAALYPWLDVPVPGVLLAGLLAQTAAVLLLTVALAVSGGRHLTAR
ncbi:hypothetical protein [Streptomyces sp. NPDC014006]|uniref:hypothetical protein n=1 Tax=Streptomyces sp. NPDC014006 TaxID=3364870 RepID=UPI0036FF617C